MQAPVRTNVLIVGAGISGIGAAIRLRRRRRVFDTAVNNAKDSVSDALLSFRPVTSVAPSPGRSEHAAE